MVESPSQRIVQLPVTASAPPAGNGQAVGVTEESTLARQVEEFRQERESWELLRQQEVERLRRDGDLLVEAWQRLEAEERRLLAERELLRRGAINGGQSMDSPNPAPAVSRATDAGTSISNSDGQNHMAWLQFQQLRREIQRYGHSAT